MDENLRIKIVSDIVADLQKKADILKMSNAQLQQTISDMLDYKKQQLKSSEQDVASILASMTFNIRAKIECDVFNSIRGFSVIDDIISDEAITEIMINGYNKIFIEKHGKVEKYPARFESPEKLLSVITKLVSEAGRSVNTSNPIVDTRLSDGSRVNVVLPPIAIDGPTVTIRRFPARPITMIDLIANGSLSSEAAEALEKLVRAKYNIFICGGTGSGKTTFLNVLSNFIPSDERIITLEDSAELQISTTENIVRLETSSNNYHNGKQINMRNLIKTSLRMRPERIIVGEVRGAEALDMLQAMNTGHDGSLSTGHANSTKDMFSRLETMVLSGAPGLPLSAIKQQICSAIDIIIHLSRLRDYSRRVLEISEVVGLEDDTFVLNPLFLFKEDKVKSDVDNITGTLKRTKYKLIKVHKLKQAGIDEEI